MKKLFYLAILIASLLVLGIGDTYANGGKRNGTAGAQELLIPVGGRGLALNGSYLAGIGGIEAMYFNPAGIVKTEGSFEAMFSQMSYLADINVSYAALGVKFGDMGAFAFSIKTLDFGDIPVTTVTTPDGDGSTFRPNYMTLTVGYANYLTDRIKIGANVKLVSEKIIRVSTFGFAIDAGVQYEGFVGVENLEIGVAIKNFGPQMNFDGSDLLRYAEESEAKRGQNLYQIQSAVFSLPSQLELGIAYSHRFNEQVKGLFAATYQDNSFQNDEYRIGTEFELLKMLFVRGGYAYVNSDLDEEKIYGPTFGLGFKFDSEFKLSVDYAFRQVEYFDANHLFSIKISL